MLDYARWKYILVSIVLLFSLLFALPNVFGDDRALQLARKDRENITADELVNIEKVFKAEGVRYRTLSDEERTRETVELLMADRVVGWYQGRMEYGPRALGNRTILAAATDAKINDVLNARLQRTEFMPFAPVTSVNGSSRSLRSRSDR